MAEVLYGTAECKVLLNKSVGAESFELMYKSLQCPGN